MISLFHGTTLEITEPLVGVGRKKVDFGFKGCVALRSQGGRNAR